MHDQRIISALSEDHITRISGLTKRQLRAWDRRGFFVPQYAYDHRSSAYSRIYSFKDAVGLRIIATLQAKPYGISIRRLENLAQKMEKDGISHWADSKVWVVKGEPHYQRPGTNQIQGAETGQLAMLEIIQIIREVESKIEDIRHRKSETFGKVERHKFIARNSWVVAGTRIPTATIRRYADAGFSTHEILAEYPTLKAEDVEAALKHEKRLAKSA